MEFAEVVQPVRLHDWLDAEKWRATGAQTVFPTADSWLWFKRRNRKELVTKGVLILGSGRLSDSVDSVRIGAVIQAIRYQESMQKINKSLTAA